MHDECKLKFVELKAKRNYQFIIFKIENQKVVVENLESLGETMRTLLNLCLLMNAAMLSMRLISPLMRIARKARFFSLHGNSNFPQISLYA